MGGSIEVRGGRGDASSGKARVYKMLHESNEMNCSMAKEDGHKSPQAASCFTFSADMLRVMIQLDGQSTRAILDTGSGVSLMKRGMRKYTAADSVSGLRLESVDGSQLKILGKCTVTSMVIEGEDIGPQEFYILDKLPRGIDVIIGNDILLRNEVTIKFSNRKSSINVENKCSRVCAVDSNQSENLLIEDKDFTATFNNGEWIVQWKFATENPTGRKQCHNYQVGADELQSFNDEIQDWIKEGVLIEWELEKHGEIKNMIPLMCVRQVKSGKTKVRPVLDYRFLNDQLASYPGGSLPSCQERLREWRMLGPDCAVMDLRRAYLQIRIDKNLWAYQVVRFNNRVYVMTRLGFGLNIAPKVMTKIVERILLTNKKFHATSYIDDIFIVERGHAASEVVKLFERYGLKSKPVEKLGVGDGVRILGLKVDGSYKWSRDKELPQYRHGTLTRRAVHGILGEWISHVPVGGWLRVACAYIQRSTAKEKAGWDDNVSQNVLNMIDETMEMIRERGDPAKGGWLVNPSGEVTVWTDASSIALGVILCVDNNIIEDAAWLRRNKDSSHINISELDAALHGVNLAVTWGFKKFCLFVDSATVYRWLKSVFNNTHTVKTHTLSQHLVRRRLEILKELKDQEKLDIEVKLVKSGQNKADVMTRIPKKWLDVTKPVNVICHLDVTKNEIKEVHEICHFGVERTAELIKEKYPERRVDAELIKRIVKECGTCLQICPTPQGYFHGKLSTTKVWYRVYSDITHFQGRAYLTLVDSCSRYCIWRDVRNESSEEIQKHIESVFSEFGPPSEFYSDNGTTYQSSRLRKMMENWCVSQHFTSAYRPQGNGMCERNHRTVKTMATRTGKTIAECVMWYNGTTGRHQASPYKLMFHAEPRLPSVRERRETECTATSSTPGRDDKDEYRTLNNNPFRVADLVYLRSTGKCDDPWTGPHRVSKIHSAVSLELNNDGVTRHVSHLRKYADDPVPMEEMRSREESEWSSETESDDSDSESGDYVSQELADLPPERVRRMPSRFSDYVLD